MEWNNLFSPEMLKEGYSLCFEKEAVQAYKQEGNTISAKVLEQNNVEIIFQDQEIMSMKCDCGKAVNNSACPHEAALLYEWEYQCLKEKDAILPASAEVCFVLIDEIDALIEKQEYEDAFHILSRIIVQLNTTEKQHLMQNAMKRLDTICLHASKTLKEQIEEWLLKELEKKHKAFLDELLYECYLKNYSNKNLLQIRMAIIDRKIESAIEGNCGDLYFQVLLESRVMLMEENKESSEAIQEFLKKYKKL